MGEVQGRKRRLADVGVSLSRQAAEPGFHCIDCLHHAGEVPPLDRFLDVPQFFVGRAAIPVPDRDRRCDKGLTDLIRAQFLKRAICINRLVVSITIEKT